MFAPSVLAEKRKTMLRRTPRSAPETIASAPPTDPIQEAVEAIAAIHTRAERHVDRHQRTMERISSTIGRPITLYLSLLAALVWIFVNLDLQYNGIPPWDAPPFFWLQGLVGLAALTTTIVVLITQRRQDVTDERRSQLDLQISLVIEQKATKIIALLEELRRDLPDVQDRHDPQAEGMSEAADPQVMLVALEHMLSEASREGDGRPDEEVLTLITVEEVEAGVSSKQEPEPRTANSAV